MIDGRALHDEVNAVTIVTHNRKPHQRSLTSARRLDSVQSHDNHDGDGLTATKAAQKRGALALLSCWLRTRHLCWSRPKRRFGVAAVTELARVAKVVVGHEATVRIEVGL